MPEIEIYTQHLVPYCTRAKQLLDRKGAAYREIDAPQGTPAREARTRAGGRTSVPQIFIDGPHVGGCDDADGAGPRRQARPAAGGMMRAALLRECQIGTSMIHYQLRCSRGPRLRRRVQGQRRLRAAGQARPGCRMPAPAATPKRAHGR